MGQERIVALNGEPPSWEAIRLALANAGFPAVLRMIDGLPAFPDEVPDSSWKELRVGFDSGMVSLRRGPSSLSCVVWGNADSALLAAWTALAEACATASTKG